MAGLLLPAQQTPQAFEVAEAEMPVAVEAPDPAVDIDTPATVLAVDDQQVPLVMLAAPPVAVAPQAAPTSLVSLAQGAVDGVFHSLSDFLASLPAGELTTTLEGALLLVRRTLFNRAPVATPVQTAVTATGQIVGDIAGRDPDGDVVTYSVLAGPQYGTVEVAVDGSYTYTPGAAYAGSDSFTVRIDGDASGFNLLNPGGHADSEVQVLVGAGAATNPFTGSAAHQDPLDAALHLTDASVEISVGKTNGRFTGSIALTNVTPETQIFWMDATGRTGEVSVIDLATEHWADYADAAEASGAGVTLGVVYTGIGGTTQAVVLTSVQATENGDGQIVLTGNLAADAASNPGYHDDFWDVVGIGFKAEYESFRREFVEVANFAPVSFAVSGADLFTDTYSLSDYKKVKTAGDPGIRLTDLSAVQNSAAAQDLSAAKSGLVAGGSCSNCTVEGFKVEITAQLDDPNGLIVGLDDGSVRQWTRIVLADGTTQNGWKILRAGLGALYQELASPSAWQPYSTSAVTAMARYGNGFVIGTQSGQLDQWTTTGWQTLGKVQDPVATIVPYRSGLLIGSTSWSASGSGNAENARTEIHQWDGQALTRIAGWGDDEGALISMITYRNGTVPLVATTDGRLRQWDGTTWTTLPETDFEGTVTAMAALKDGSGDGFVVGEATFTRGGSGSLTQWTGSEWKDLGALDSAVTAIANVSGFGSETTSFVFGLEDGTMKVSFVTNGQRGVYQLRDGQGFGGNPVKSIIPTAGGSFAVGLADGSVWRFSGDLASALRDTSGYAGWTQLRGPAVVDDDGPIGDAVDGHGVGSSQWSWYGFPGNPSKFNAASGNASLIASGDGLALIVNQKTGAPGDSFNAGKISNGLVSLYAADGVLQIDDKGTNQTNDDEIRINADGTAITGPGWVEVRSSGISSFSQDLLKQGVTFAQGINGFKTGPGTTATNISGFGTSAAGVLGSADPLFGPTAFGLQNLPSCMANKTCTGTFKTFAFVGNPEYPTSLVKKNFLVGSKNTDPRAGGGSYGGTGTPNGTNISNQSMDVSLDLSPTVYGYVFDPDGVWNAMDVNKWSAAVMVAGGIGPSFNLRLGGRSDGVIDVARESIAAFRPVAVTLPSGVGIFSVNAGLDATIRLTLDLPENYETLPWYRNNLSIWARVTSGMLISYNTAASDSTDPALTGATGSKWRVGEAAYFDYDFSDFAAVQGLTISPSLIPYVDMSVGLDAPKGSPWPLSEGASIYRVAVGYENPLSLNLNYPRNGEPSQNFSAGGNLTLQAGILEGLGIPAAKKLTYKTVYPIYSVKTQSVPLPFS